MTVCSPIQVPAHIGIIVHIIVTSELWLELVAHQPKHRSNQHLLRHHDRSQSHCGGLSLGTYGRRTNLKEVRPPRAISTSS